jgi:IS30 family transposase
MRTIAKDLNVSHTTVSREIKRNSGKRGYRFNQADGVKLSGAFMMRIYIILSKEEQKVFSTPPILTNFFWRIKKP